MLPNAVLWVDPGKMTGVAWYWAGPGGFAAGEHDFMAAGDVVENGCQAWGTYLAIGWERFAIRPKTPPDDAHHAIEMIGVCRRYALRYGCRILQPAAPGDRDVATMRMLKALGWWTPGKDDAQSAAQHMLAWLMRTGQVPPKEQAIMDGLRGR